jgi:hypothetical protein
VGDASEAGFEALRLSIWSVWNLFGSDAQYTVCVNSVPLRTAMERTGELPPDIAWLPADEMVPSWLYQYTSSEMAEGVAWKLAPVRVFPHSHELSLDNDVILWNLPPAIEAWLHCPDPGACLMAADLRSALGQFSGMCNHQALNSGIRGLPPGFDMESKLRETLSKTGITLQSELDEQGLQAAVLLHSRLFVVSTADVSICSPFPDHQHHLGRCGAHFVGLNAKRLPWMLEGRGAHETIRENWNRYSDDLARLVPNAFAAMRL